MKLPEQQDILAFSRFIESHNYFLIIGHKEPDGDCIASCIGAAAIIEKSGKPYRLLSAGPFKRNEIKKYESLFSSEIDFMDESERKSTGLIITDCSEMQRLGDIDGDLHGFDTFVIDHHKTSGLPEGVNGYINSEAPACALLIQLFYEAIVGKIPEDLAKTLFFGLCTDTGFFRFLEGFQ